MTRWGDAQERQLTAYESGQRVGAYDRGALRVAAPDQATRDRIDRLRGKAKRKATKRKDRQRDQRILRRVEDRLARRIGSNG
jgi:hypothetical protein